MTLQTQAVLAAFLEDPTADHYGLDLSRSAGLRSGTIYPILARLEEAGWVESSWEAVDPAEVGRPARRYYRVTDLGAARARDEIEKSIRRLTRPTLRPQGQPT
jgi:PadR family transcriptional regulator, regulatory protein PadR